MLGMILPRGVIFLRDPERLLHVIRHDIYPVTERLVAEGNNLFGAAVLAGPNLDVVVVGSNRREEDPTLHGEIATIHAFYALPQRPDPAETVFLSTHEPCPMCAAALAWCGFREVYFLFDYRETARDFAMPGDLEILRELFGASSLRHENAFFKMVPVRFLAEGSPKREELLREIDSIKALYRNLKVKGVNRKEG
jgi:tRNA(Arg) A34 adenosine deaminase TadA